MANVTDQLVDVRFYTNLDPYHYTIDNRPLQDLNTNVLLIAEASDAASGGADRAALSGASLGYSMLGFGGLVNTTGTAANAPYFVDRGMYSGKSVVDGLRIYFEHGFATVKTSGGTIGGRAYDLPALAIHDTIADLQFTPGGAGQTYLVQGKWRDSTTTDRVPSGQSPVLVLEISLKASPLGQPPLLDAGAIAIMRVDLPAGTTVLTDSNITYLNYRDINQTSNVLDRAKISYNEYVTNLSSGLQNISLNGTDIDPDKIDSVEIFIQGVNQFNWTYNSANNQITLESPLTEDASVRVRQTVIGLA